MHNKEGQDGSEKSSTLSLNRHKISWAPTIFYLDFIALVFSAGVKEIIGQKHYYCEGSYSLENND